MALLVVVLLSVMTLMSTTALAVGPEIVAQGLPTPTPFRFLTPTPFTLPNTSTTTTTTTTMPRAGGIPLELAIPALAGGLAALGGGSIIVRRRRS
jgi:hypothetical protein